MSQTVAAPIPAAVDHERTLVLAIEVSNKSWVLAAQVPGLPHTKAKRTCLGFWVEALLTQMTTRSPGRSCARVWAELQVVAILRTVGSVVEVGYLVAAVCDWRESVVRVHDGFDEYLVSFGALSASRRSLLVLTTNEGRQLAGPRAGIPSLGLGSFACPRDGKNNVISQNETLRRRDHPIDVE